MVFCEHTVCWIRRVRIVPNDIFCRVIDADIRGRCDIFRHKPHNGGDKRLLLNCKDRRMYVNNSQYEIIEVKADFIKRLLEFGKLT
jgi:hypothetical protein